MLPVSMAFLFTKFNIPVYKKSLLLLMIDHTCNLFTTIFLIESQFLEISDHGSNENKLR